MIARTRARQAPGATHMLGARHRVPWLLYAVALALSVVFLFPLFWMATTSLKTMEQAYAFPPRWIPSPVVWENYVRLFTELPFLSFSVNSVIIAVLNTIGVVFSSALCAFGFARRRARGREFRFIVLLSTIMLPYQVILVPTFILFKQLGWIDTFLPLIVPAFFGGGAFNSTAQRRGVLGCSYAKNYDTPRGGMEGRSASATAAKSTSL
jgi:ABC-type glycerol-3-phosphate transport system permease component